MHERHFTFFITVENGSKNIRKKKQKEFFLMFTSFLFCNFLLSSLITTLCISTEKKGKGLGSYIDKLRVDPTAGIKYLVWAVKIY